MAVMIKVARQIRLYLAGAMALVFVGGWLLSFAPALFAQSQNQIALVVVHGDGSTLTRCVEFAEPELTGYDVLQRSELALNIDASSMGTAICSLDGEGCIAPQEDCFCGMNRTPSVYWSYWKIENSEWKYSTLGASNTVVQPGAVQGWKWGTGDVNAAVPPPAYSFDQICAPATATPTETLTPLPTSTELATATFEPTATPTETATETPTSTPTSAPTETTVPTFTPTWTAAPTWTPTGMPTETPLPTVTLLPTGTWTPESATATITPMPTSAPVSVDVVAQATVAQGYALRLPAVQASAPTIVVKIATVENVPVEVAIAAPAAAVEPTATLLPTETPLPTATILPTATPEPIVTEPPPTLVPEVITVVVTPIEATPVVVAMAEVVSATTLLPAVAPTASAAESQLRSLGVMVMGAGMLIALPVGLVIVAGLAYWVGRKL